MKVAPWLFAVVATGFGLLLRVPVWSLLRDEVPFLTFFPAVLLTAWRYGLSAGLFATFLCCVVSIFVLILPASPDGSLTSADLIAVLYFAGICSLMSWILEQMRQARDQSEQQRRLTYQTLSSVGDAVITTDRQARVSFMNSIAEQLTGWKNSEAAGKPVTDILRITHETTGDEVENPVARVLRDGKITGLANHTLLTARDGRVAPIDDSGAPITDED